MWRIVIVTLGDSLFEIFVYFARIVENSKLSQPGRAQETILEQDVPVVGGRDVAVVPVFPVQAVHHGRLRELRSNLRRLILESGGLKLGFKCTYPPKVVHLCGGSDGSSARESRIEEEFAQHFRLIVHVRTGHSERY